MKAKQVEEILVIGGAGFIGSHIFRLLIKHGYEAIVLDNLESQIHGKREKNPTTHKRCSRYSFNARLKITTLLTKCGRSRRHSPHFRPPSA